MFYFVQSFQIHVPSGSQVIVNIPLEYSFLPIKSEHIYSHILPVQLLLSSYVHGLRYDAAGNWTSGLPIKKPNTMSLGICCLGIVFYTSSMSNFHLDKSNRCSRPFCGWMAQRNREPQNFHVWRQLLKWVFRFICLVCFIALHDDGMILFLRLLLQVDHSMSRDSIQVSNLSKEFSRKNWKLQMDGFEVRSKTIEFSKLREVVPVEYAASKVICWCIVYYSNSFGKSLLTSVTISCRISVTQIS